MKTEKEEMNLLTLILNVQEAIVPALYTFNIISEHEAITDYFKVENILVLNVLPHNI